MNFGRGLIYKGVDKKFNFIKLISLTIIYNSSCNLIYVLDYQIIRMMNDINSIFDLGKPVAAILFSDTIT